MLRCVRPSVCLSVPFSDSVSFANWRHARAAASNAYDRGQHVGCARIQMLSVCQCDNFRTK